jgi:hypothetical protein
VLERSRLTGDEPVARGLSHDERAPSQDEHRIAAI